MNKSDVVELVAESSCSMNKTDVVEFVAQHAPMTKTSANAALKTLADAATYALMGIGGEIVLPGIGKLKIKERPARMGRNPATGAPVEIPAKRVVTFVAAKALKDAVA